VTATSVERVNGTPLPAEPRFEYDPVALAEAEAIRTRAAAEADAVRREAEGRAEAEKLLAAEKAEKERIANERAAMRLEKERADHLAHLAKKAAEAAKSKAEEEKAKKAEQEATQREAQQIAEQERAERYWKWGARGIYAVGLIIAAPVQFMHFWDRERPFLVAAPGLLEGLAIVLAFGATWAVAHRRDVAPYRIGIMFSAMIAAAHQPVRRPVRPADRLQRRPHRRHRLARRADRPHGLRARHRPEGRRHPVLAGTPAQQTEKAKTEAEAARSRAGARGEAGSRGEGGGRKKAAAGGPCRRGAEA
jgi:hypothetical protein